MPLLALLVMCFVGTMILHLFSIFALQITGINIDFMEGIRLVTLPSTLLNLLIALPIYTFMTDFANWIYPLEVKT